MSRYDGLIIPRSYSEYLNKTDSATLSQMLQHLTGLWSHAVSAGDQKPVTSNAVNSALGEYINKTDAATLQQALQLPGVLSGAVAAGDNKPVTSDAVNVALSKLQNKEGFGATNEVTAYFKINIGPDNACLLNTRGGESWLFTSGGLTDDINVSANKLSNAFNKIGGLKTRDTTVYFYCSAWATAFIVIELVNNTPIPKVLAISESEYNSI